MKSRVLAALLATLTLCPPLAAQAPPASPMRLGVNDNWINYWANDGRYNDVMAGANPWNAGGKTLDPTSLPAGAACIAATEGYTRPGIYTLSATGKGQVFCGINSANLLPAGPGVLPANLTATFTGKGETYQFKLAASARTLMQIPASDATTPIGNVKILAPGAGVGLYHPGFLASISGFDTIRMMDPQGTSGSKEVKWADRNQQYGQDLESMIELANATGSNLWVCLPVRCVSARGGPTDYPAELGKLINARLNPNLTAYIEYSNEVWNYSLPWWDESTYVFNSALAEYGGSIGLDAQYARMAHAAFSVIPQRPEGPKIRRVLARQLANAATATNALTVAAARGWQFDVLAGGMYWDFVGLDANAVKAAWTTGDQATAFGLIDAAFRAGLKQELGWVAAYKVLATQYGLELAAYEGGPAGGALWNDGAGAPIMTAYYRTAMGQQMVLDGLNAHAAAGVSLFNIYSHCHDNPYWSFRGKHIDDYTDRRYRAARQYLAGAPPAVYMGQDVATQGNWVGTYGTLAAMVAGVPPTTPPPPGLTPLPAPAASLFVQAAAGTTTDVRAPQVPGGPGRVAAWWYSPTEVDLDVPAAADGSPRVLSLYFLEWQAWGDNFTIQVKDVATGNTLDTRPVPAPAYAQGVYLRWAVEGHVKVSLRQSWGTAKLSGVFLDPIPAP